MNSNQIPKRLWNQLNAVARAVACATALSRVSAGVGPQPQAGPVPQAPPPAPPIEHRALPPQPPSPRPHGPTLYSIGNPTDEEQLYLECINRSRANPPAEGVRLASTTDPDVLSAYDYFSVDLTLMQSQFQAISAAPPLAMNAQLLAAARLHSGDMFTNQYQDHYETNGTKIVGPGDRITAQGYPWSTYGENVYSTAKSVWYGHAGFNVDWGPGPGGMQTPAGHRANIASSTFREVGIGIVDGTNGMVGPQLVTQDFATRQSATPLITGVVYYDFDGNNFYDLGEGIGGVSVDVTGSSYHAVTADSGGYAVPVPGSGTYTVTFSAAGLSSQRQVSVSGSNNLKVDYLPVYAPPVISGPNPAAINQSNAYAFTPVGAATKHQWERASLAPFSAVEGAESGLANVTAVTSPGYAVVASDVKFAGNYSFHLAQPDPPTDQVLTLNYTLRPGASSQLTFYGRLGWAGSSQIARAQVSADNGGHWQDVWTQAGTDGPGEGIFSSHAVSLGSFANQQINIRFVYDFTGGSYFPQTDAGVGLYLDNISVSGAEQLSNPVTTDIPSGTSFVFAPTTAGDYSLRVRAQVSNRYLDWGPLLRVTATTLVPVSVQFSATPTVTTSQAQIDFSVTNYRAGTVFQLLTASTVDGTWTTNTAATFQTLVSNSTFRVTIPTGGASKMFYRLQAN